MEKHELRAKYDQAASWYDLVEGVPELLGVRRLRRKLVRHLRGRVLEVAAGTGKSFRYYPAVRHPIAIDLSLPMLRIARRRAQQYGLDAQFAVMDVEVLAIRDQCADTVLSSLTLCTFPDPVRALREMARVCRPDGRILLLEHGRSTREWLGRWQDRGAERHARMLGCHWNREPLVLVREAGLDLERTDRTFFGIFHLLIAHPRHESRPSSTDGRARSAVEGALPTGHPDAKSHYRAQ